MSDPQVQDLTILTGIVSSLTPKLELMLDCVCQTLEANGRATCCCCVYPGQEVPWDYCGKDTYTTQTTEGETIRIPCEGMAYVNVKRIYPSKSFPWEDQEADPCKAYTQVADVRVGVLRCAPTISDNGNLPPCEDLTSAAAGLLVDQAIVTTAIRCCYLKELPCDNYDIKVGGWRMLGPQGGCIGGELNLFVSL